jgi:hypothetical protein
VVTLAGGKVIAVAGRRASDRAGGAGVAVSRLAPRDFVGALGGLVHRVWPFGRAGARDGGGDGDGDGDGDRDHDDDDDDADPDPHRSRRRYGGGNLGATWAAWLSLAASLSAGYALVNSVPAWGLDGGASAEALADAAGLAVPPRVWWWTKSLGSALLAAAMITLVAGA